MLLIGDFAGITGLSVKALRHYDEKSVLVPESVEDGSGYRLYAESQVRAGVVVRALRAAGVPLHAVGAVDGTNSAIDVLDTHRRLVLEERLKEDRVYEDTKKELRSLRAPVLVEERVRPRQPFVGRVLSVSADEAEALTNDEANDVFGELFERLARAGVKLSGRFWTTLRSGKRGQAELIGCWAVPEAVVGNWCGKDDITGILPARSDLVATWRPADGEELPDSATHPAIVAIFDALGARGIDLRLDRMEVHQTVRGQGEEDHAVEVSVCIGATQSGVRSLRPLY